MFKFWFCPSSLVPLEGRASLGFRVQLWVKVLYSAHALAQVSGSVDLLSLRSYSVSYSTEQDCCELLHKGWEEY